MSSKKRTTEARLLHLTAAIGGTNLDATGLVIGGRCSENFRCRWRLLWHGLLHLQRQADLKLWANITVNAVEYGQPERPLKQAMGDRHGSRSIQELAVASDLLSFLLLAYCGGLLRAAQIQHDIADFFPLLVALINSVTLGKSQGTEVMNEGKLRPPIPCEQQQGATTYFELELCAPHLVRLEGGPIHEPGLLYRKAEVKEARE